MASSTLQNFEQLSYGAPGLSIHRAKATQVIGDAVATRTLTAKESGATCLFDAAAGVVVDERAHVENGIVAAEIGRAHV